MSQQLCNGGGNHESAGRKRAFPSDAATTAIEAGLSFDCDGAFYSPHSNCTLLRTRPSFSSSTLLAGSLQRDVSVLLIARALSSAADRCLLYWDCCCGCAVRSLRFHVGTPNHLSPLFAVPYIILRTRKHRARLALLLLSTPYLPTRTWTLAPSLPTTCKKPPSATDLPSFTTML
jgi:hypothetical protein